MDIFDLLTNFWFLVFAFVTLTSIAGTIGNFWYKAKQAELKLRQLEIEAALKQEMLQRGLSAGDIERVLGARSGSAKKPASSPALEETVIKS